MTKAYAQTIQIGRHTLMMPTYLAETSRNLLLSQPTLSASLEVDDYRLQVRRRDAATDGTTGMRASGPNTFPRAKHG